MNLGSKKITISITTICFCTFLFLPQLALAQAGNTASGDTTDVKKGLDVTADAAHISKEVTGDKLPAMMGRLINYFFGILGVVFLIVILIGGYMWMSAGGNEEKVGEAKGWIVNGINGMIVVFLAYVLVYTMLFALKSAIGS